LFAFSVRTLALERFTRKHCLQIAGLQLSKVTEKAISYQKQLLIDSTASPLWRMIIRSEQVMVFPFVSSRRISHQLFIWGVSHKQRLLKVSKCLTVFGNL